MPCGSPEVLLRAMMDNRDAYSGVESSTWWGEGPSEYCRPENGDHFIHNSLFAGTSSRESINQGRAVFTPCHFSQIPRLFAEKILRWTLRFACSPHPTSTASVPTASRSTTQKPAAENSKLVIAEVSPHMPRTLGNSFIHISKIHCIVETDSNRSFSLRPDYRERREDRKVLRGVIRDGDCLQLHRRRTRRGALLPEAQEGPRNTHRDVLGRVVDLVNSGVITCARKNFHPAKWSPPSSWERKALPLREQQSHGGNVSRRLHQQSGVVARNDNMVSINSALQVDLLGQAVSDNHRLPTVQRLGRPGGFRTRRRMVQGRTIDPRLHSTASGGKDIKNSAA